MKKILVFSLINLLLGCIQPKIDPNMPLNDKGEELLLSNEINLPIHWPSFPVNLSFHSSVPLKVQGIIIQEINSLNFMFNKKIFEISSFSCELKDKEKNGNNCIYFGKIKDFSFYTGEEQEANTSLYLDKDTYLEVDLYFNQDYYLSPSEDFPSLVRHELMHALGVRHLKEGLMSLYSSHTERPYEKDIILALKNFLEKKQNQKESKFPTKNLISNK